MAIAENTAVSLGAKLVTNSFGYPETQFNTTDAAAFNHSGDVIAASTGDDGWRDFDYLGTVGAPYNMADAPVRPEHRGRRSAEPRSTSGRPPHVRTRRCGTTTAPRTITSRR